MLKNKNLKKKENSIYGIATLRQSIMSIYGETEPPEILDERINNDEMIFINTKTKELIAFGTHKENNNYADWDVAKKQYMRHLFTNGFTGFDPTMGGDDLGTEYEFNHGQLPVYMQWNDPDIVEDYQTSPFRPNKAFDTLQDTLEIFDDFYDFNQASDLTDVLSKLDHVIRDAFPSHNARIENNQLMYNQVETKREMVDWDQLTLKDQKRIIDLMNDVFQLTADHMRFIVLPMYYVRQIASNQLFTSIQNAEAYIKNNQSLFDYTVHVYEYKINET